MLAPAAGANAITEMAQRHGSVSTNFTNVVCPNRIAIVTGDCCISTLIAAIVPNKNIETRNRIMFMTRTEFQ